MIYSCLNLFSGDFQPPFYPPSETLSCVLWVNLCWIRGGSAEEGKAVGALSLPVSN